MSIDIKKKIKKAANRSFLARDFESLRTELIQHARVYYPDKIQDFSEPSVGGMLVDFAATVGDSLSFYLDHEFRELDPQTAVEPSNIVTHLRNAGVEIYGAAAASVDLTFSFNIPAEKVTGGYRPKRSSLPVIMRGTTCESLTGVSFTTIQNLDFAELDLNGNLVCEYVVKTADDSGIPTMYTVSRSVPAASGLETSETVTLSDKHVPFREVTLSNENITTIISVKDADNQEYYEVAALSQDTVFRAVRNFNDDHNSVTNNLEIHPAPHRYVRRVNPTTRLTTVRFGSGDASTLDDDIIPDPSELSLSLYGKTNFPRFQIDPNSLLNTQTLGISPRGTTLTFVYRYGGGLSHNVVSNSINSITSLQLEFRQTPNPSDALVVRQSLEVINKFDASGGANPPTLETLRQLIPIARQSQSRTVTREDLLARIYTLPSEFGSVYRAGLAPNTVNPLSSLLYIVSLDKNGRLTISPDSLKKNLSNYLNEFRLISDAVDILDAQIINFSVKYDVVVSESVNKTQVVQNINNRLADALQKKYFQIDQPLIIDDITNLIINTDFVIALSDLRVSPRVGTVEDRSYSSANFPFERSTKRGIIYGPSGSIFELKYPEFDLIGSAM